ncbi:hypothetical protein [Pelomicrobium methylotrophicum]|uniref:HEAT repeat domain-containing protein n=1 Tax=Pelomicrobium methylotrophicum TaxID=2602750 RepID=A0A5C7EX37_9PROT|nr:hypothetical protein [Pelomicrobium methylotrophicum]TXF11615.1 hypothetical protein FR698_09760 [Pelomicrobium methylotrophicum]
MKVRTEASLRLAARRDAEYAVLEKASREPEKVADALTSDPELLVGLRSVEELIKVLLDHGQDKAVSQLLHDRRTPKWARRIIASALLAFPR